MILVVSPMVLAFLGAAFIAVCAGGVAVLYDSDDLEFALVMGCGSFLFVWAVLSALLEAS